MFIEIHWTSDVDVVPSRGRPAARETTSDAHSRKTTVSFGPLQPIFQQGVLDKLLAQRERRAELWRRPKKGPSSAACASQWRQPSPLAMTQMRWPTEASEHRRRRGVSPCASVVPAFAHTKSAGSSPRPRVLSCLVSCHLRDVAGESRRLVDNQVEGLQQADTSSRMNTAILGAFFARPTASKSPPTPGEPSHVASDMVTASSRLSGAANISGAMSLLSCLWEGVEKSRAHTFAYSALLALEVQLGGQRCWFPLRRWVGSLVHQTRTLEDFNVKP